jgi:RNA polymerase sigma factor (sigma-70 family)
MASAPKTISDPTQPSSEKLTTLLGIAFRIARREGLSTSDAEDVASIAVMDFLEVYDEVLHPRAWICAVAKRKAWAFRQRSAVRRRLLEENHDQLRPRPDLEANPVEILLDLRAALTSLSQIERQMVLGRHLKGESLEVIATSAGVSVETIKRRLKRSRLSLKRNLSGRSVRSSFRQPLAALSP